uniref:Uncharacterized protein n=1 Tax=Mycena chlorophos TaxID=658473 RepID=A0ABQ0KZA7_MYCCL|nr:predicted protein [Mycena chlorophos]
MRNTLESNPILLGALSSRPHTLRQARSLTRFVRSHILKKERVLLPHRPLASTIDNLLANRVTRRTRTETRTPGRLPISFDQQHDPFLAAPSLKAPLPALISPSSFPSPFTPHNQLLHTPFVPPKATPRRIQYRSPVADENSSPAFAFPESPVARLSKRLIAPPSKNVSRRLSYPQSATSAWSPDHHPMGNLASPVFIRSASSLFASAARSPPLVSPRFELDQLHFSPFQFDVLSF